MGYFIVLEGNAAVSVPGTVPSVLGLNTSEAVGDPPTATVVACGVLPVF